MIQHLAIMFFQVIYVQRYVTMLGQGRRQGGKNNIKHKNVFSIGKLNQKQFNYMMRVEDGTENNEQITNPLFKNKLYDKNDKNFVELQ